MTPSAVQKNVLWPFGITAALASIPLIWIGMVLILMVTRRVAEWPDAESRSLLTYFTLLASLLPLALVLFDFAADRRAVFGFKGFNVDFSKIDVTQPHVGRESFLLPDNIGQPGAIATDSSPMQILKVLEDVTRHDVVRIDLGAGDSWWATRLLALAAGAVRVGAPRVMVFVARRYNVDGVFLAWLTPAAVQAALLRARSDYRETFDRAKTITTQLVAFSKLTAPPPLPIDVLRYQNSAAYVGLGEAAFEQILLDQLAVKGLENKPDTITLTRFADLFEPDAYRDAIDLEWPNDRRVATLLETGAEYIAVTRGGRYESMVQRGVAERLILRELVRQSLLRT